MEEITRVVIPVDSTEASRIATEQGAFFAKLLGVEVTLVTVNEARQFMVSTVLENKMHHEREEMLEEIKKTAEKRGVTVNTNVMMGKPGEEISKFAKDTDLIVMASHGKKGFNKFFLGSVSEEILRKAPCSVMIIKPNTQKKPIGFNVKETVQSP